MYGYEQGPDFDDVKYCKNEIKNLVMLNIKRVTSSEISTNEKTKIFKIAYLPSWIRDLDYFR